MGRRRPDKRQGLLEEREQIGVDQHGAVVGVLDQEGQLFGRHPEVERVQHASGARDGEVRLQVPGAVPCQRRHAVPGPETKMLEGVHQLLGPAAELGVGQALDHHPTGERLTSSASGAWFGAWSKSSHEFSGVSIIGLLRFRSLPSPTRSRRRRHDSPSRRQHVVTRRSVAGWVRRTPERRRGGAAVTGTGRSPLRPGLPPRSGDRRGLGQPLLRVGVGGLAPWPPSSSGCRVD